MFAWLRYRYQLSRLQLKRRSYRADYPAHWKAIGALNEDILILTSNYLVDTAEKLFIEVPRPSPPEWTHSDETNRVFLTEGAMRKLRAAIRTERKERSELARSWLSGITGLIGVLIGLLAVILGRR